MPFTSYMNWLFDGNPKSVIPEISAAKNSPINQAWLVRMFALNPNLNAYLNEYFNNNGLWYIDKVDLMKFMKKCVIDFKVQRSSIPWSRARTQTDKLYNVLRDKIVTQRDDEISLLCEIVNRSENRSRIYTTLGLAKPKKATVKKKKTKKKDGVITAKNYVEQNFKFKAGF